MKEREKFIEELTVYLLENHPEFLLHLIVASDPIRFPLSISCFEKLFHSEEGKEEEK